jgi:hypothetical protein
MEVPTPQTLARLPLAEAVLWLWAWIMREERINTLWETCRGRCYERALSFPVLLQLVADAVLRFEGSGRRSFDHALQEEVLDCSVQAAYRKLGRLPLPLSRGLLSQGTADLREVFPHRKQRELPATLAGFELIILDGKTVKHVVKRLKPLRGVAGGLVGGRALVAQQWSTEMAIAMEAHPDGDINEVRLVEPLVAQVRALTVGARLWMADRGFCDLRQPAHFTADAADRFLVRYHPKVKFHVDGTRCLCRGTEQKGRTYVEDWGWLGGEHDPRRRYVRRIRMSLSDNPKDDLILITDLVDADAYPAKDLLHVYGERWGIEHMFQDVTEVFGLKHLIGGTPQACLFQLAFCLLLYNMISVVRAYVAQGQQRPIDEVSEEKLFEDIECQLIAWHIMIDMPTTLAHFEDVPTAVDLRAMLKRLLNSTWQERWEKSPAQPPRVPTPRKRTRSHHSTYRIIQAVSHARLKARKKARAAAMT